MCLKRGKIKRLTVFIVLNEYLDRKEGAEEKELVQITFEYHDISAI